jgi:hypothetical protein
MSLTFALRIRLRNGYVAPMRIERPQAADIESLALASRSGWPDDLRVLLERYPREQWEGHANLGDMAATADTANALLRALAASDGGNLTRCGDDYAAASGSLIKSLVRHLDDEEDLIVPLILDRGEEALGVGHG